FREWARHQLVNWRRSSAYASLVSPRYPARNPASASRSASLNASWMGTRAVVVVAVIRPLPDPGGGRRGRGAADSATVRPAASRRSVDHVTVRERRRHTPRWGTLPLWRGLAVTPAGRARSARP